MSISYKTLPSLLYQEVELNPVSDPKIILFNSDLAHDLGLTEDKEFYTKILSGNDTYFEPTPIAQAYSGHQFGFYNTLGDGRAMLLAELQNKNGHLKDLQLKGSGLTPYSRRGDGRATLSAMLREYLFSEAMTALNIPSTRSLAVVSTGEPVYREKAHLGGVLTRIADSHIRVGTFEFVRNNGTLADIKALADYTINRHYPNLKANENLYLTFLEAVIDRQIDLLINWYRVGFVHGVMNTDNMSIAGETIDYGPCAFLNVFSQDAVFSSIDENGRYSFGNQSHIGLWNLTRFAETLLPLFHENTEEAVKLATAVLEKYRSKYDTKWQVMFSKKLGLSETTPLAFLNELKDFMQTHEADYTLTFIKLSNPELVHDPVYDQEDFIIWHKKWQSLRPDLETMRSVNPLYIPRNKTLETVLHEASSTLNLESFNDFLVILKNPYDYSNIKQAYVLAPLNYDKTYLTYCNT